MRFGNPFGGRFWAGIEMVLSAERALTSREVDFLRTLGGPPFDPGASGKKGSHISPPLGGEAKFWPKTPILSLGGSEQR